MDRPSADQLRTAIAASRAGVEDRGADEARYLERVASNLESILEREQLLLDDAMAATIASFSAVVGPWLPDPQPTATEQAASLRHALDRGLRDGALSPTDELLTALRDDATRRLAIARPGYLHSAT